MTDLQTRAAQVLDTFNNNAGDSPIGLLRSQADLSVWTAETATLQLVRVLLMGGEPLKARQLLESCLPIHAQNSKQVQDTLRLVQKYTEHADSFAAYKDYYTPFADAHGEPLADKNLMLLGRYHAAMAFLEAHLPEQPFTVLDIGCGDGTFEHVVATKFKNASFLVSDVSKNDGVLEALNTLHGPRFSSYAPTDFYDLAPSGETFDLVMALEVVEHVPDQDAFLKALYAKVKPGGYLLLTTPDARFWMERVVLTRQEPYWHLTASTADTLHAHVTEHFSPDAVVRHSAEMHTVLGARKLP